MTFIHVIFVSRPVKHRYRGCFRADSAEYQTACTRERLPSTAYHYQIMIVPADDPIRPGVIISYSVPTTSGLSPSMEVYIAW